MKIQVVQKGADPNANKNRTCPWFIDVPPPGPDKD